LPRKPWRHMLPTRTRPAPRKRFIGPGNLAPDSFFPPPGPTADDSESHYSGGDIGPQRVDNAGHVDAQRVLRATRGF